ncbi:hypothetical protein O0L34_g8869 [Tuta absoluta]|nr:hypothetical protein O0L34_g8869 [Tuta absoluta]
MHKYFVDAELNSMLGPTYDSSEYSEGTSCANDGSGAVGASAGGGADSFARSVSRYGLRFTAALLSVLAIIDRMPRDNNNKLLNVSARLKFNTYYERQLEKFCLDDTLVDAEKRGPAASPRVPAAPPS